MEQGAAIVQKGMPPDMQARCAAAASAAVASGADT